jgi:ABC-type antimicrobial peptide transport system permease subunit
MTQLVASFGAFALLLLAAMGLYGIVAYSVRQRLHEMGIRIALVASYGDILALVVGKGVQLAIIDVALGTPAAFAASRALGSPLRHQPARPHRIHLRPSRPDRRHAGRQPPSCAAGSQGGSHVCPVP